MNEIVSKVIVNIVIALLGLAASYSILLINKAKQKIDVETEQIKDDKQRALARDALEQVNILAAKTVISIEQTTAKALREAVKDGTTNREELLGLADQAHLEILQELKPKYREVLEKEINDINKYISDTVEEKVFELKNFGVCSYK